MAPGDIGAGDAVTAAGGDAFRPVAELAAGPLEPVVAMAKPVRRHTEERIELDVGGGDDHGTRPSLDEDRQFQGRKMLRREVLDLFTSIADICDVPTPGGAFYCLPRVRTPLTAMTVMERLVREHKVAAIAGETFGLTEGCYLRVSYGAWRS